MTHGGLKIPKLVAEGGLYLLAVGAPLAIGGVHRPVIVAAALVACVSLTALWIHRRQAGRALHASWFGGALLLLVGYTLLQALPLPVGLLRTIAPANYNVLEVSLAGVGGVPSWHAISLDSGATLWEALKLGLCAVAFIVAHNLLHRRRPRARLLWILTLCGSVAVLVGIAGVVIAPNKPWLLYLPQAERIGGLITVCFVNPNHAAAFLVLCTAAGLGLTMDHHLGLQRRALVGVATVFLAMGVLLTLSRGGILAVGVCAGTFIGLDVMLKRQVSARALVIPGILVLATIIVALLAWDALEAQFQQLIPSAENLGKIEQWPAGLSMIQDNKWVGVGRGAFLTAFPRYLETSGIGVGATWSHMENQYLHLPAEWGILVGSVAILAGPAALLVWIRGGRQDPIALAMAAALVGLGVHGLFDFNLELLGVALPAATLAGALSAGHRLKSRPARRRPGRVVVWGAPVGVAGLVGLTVVALQIPSIGQDEAKLSWLSRQASTSLEQINAATAAVIHRRPADYYPHLLQARILIAKGKNGQAIASLNRAMILNPGDPRMHLLTARLFRKLGHPKQSLLECKLALSVGAPRIKTIRWALPICSNIDDIKRLLPDDPAIRMIAIRELFRIRRLKLAEEVLVWSRAQRPLEGYQRLSVEILLALGRNTTALAEASQLARSSPSLKSHLLWAQAARKTHNTRAELKVLKQAQQSFEGEVALDFALAEAHFRAKQLAEAINIVEKIKMYADDRATKARAHRLAARLYRSAGRHHQAQLEAEDAKKYRKIK